MNDKELRSRVNAELSNISWSARNSSAVRQRVNQGGTVMKRKMSFAFVLAMILVAACIATAVAGAVSEEFNTWLYQLWPEAALKLMPVDLSCENNGIRMDVLSASADESEVLITYTLQDMEGDRLFEGVTEIYPRVFTDGRLFESRKGAEHYNEEDHKLYSAAYAQYTGQDRSEDESLILRVELFGREEQHTVELFPYLRDRDSEVRMADVPEDAVVRRPYVEPDNRTFSESGLPETMQVIDSSASLEIPLFESVYLSGAKIVDGWAHIQLHFAENGYISSTKKVLYHQYGSTLSLYDAEDNDLPYADDALYDGCRVLYWGYSDSFDPTLAEWVEYIFPVDAAAVEKAASLPVMIEKGISPIDANLAVQIPVRLIKGTK